MSPSLKSAEPDARLLRLLGGVELAALRLRLRRHFESRAGDGVEGRLQLSKLNAVEHEALTQLMGRPARASRAESAGHTARIDVPALDALLQGAGIATSLRDALEQLDGPIVNRIAARKELQARWVQVSSAPPMNGRLAAWLQEPDSLGLLKRLARQDPEAALPLLERASAVLQKLPAQGLTRAQLAADTLGNSHALDNGQATATLVLAVLQAIESKAEAESGEAESGEASQPVAERARDIWARAGVLVNELARPALYLNLPTQPASGFQPLAGEPGFLSLRQLLRMSIAWDVAGLMVYVCENPNIVSIAADRLGAACAPLVCTEGMPAAAQRVLLLQLAQAGARLLYHGDFDWPGLHIAKQVMALCGAQPWRFGHADYTAAVRTAPHTERDLYESTLSAPWDAELAPAMRQQGLAIAEEAVVASLLPDLGYPGR